jgi:probable F420-dependent oxidoreductase
VWVLDVRRDPFLLAAAALDATEALEVGTNVAVAFARSPTVTAVLGWDLSAMSGGRFVLGLGSQVGPTLAARFGVEADHPGPRMRDYVGACRACFEAFAKGYGRYDGEFYKLRRPAFQPGAEPDVSPPPVYLAAVNPFMTAIAGECADGLAAHPFTTERYLEEVMRPALEMGAGRAGRPAPPVLLQVVVAPDRESAAKQMIAYTVPAYRRVLDHAGLGGTADEVMAASKEGRRIEARTIIEERYLDLLGVTTLEDLPAAITRWAPHCDRLSLSVPWFGMTDDEQLALVHELVGAVGAMPAS